MTQHWSDPPPLENALGHHPRGRKARYSRALLEETIRVWQPFYDVPLSDDEAHDIIENMTRFAAMLLGLSGTVRPRAEDSSETDKSRP